MRYVLLVASFATLFWIVAGQAGDGMEACQQRHSFDTCAANLWR